MGKKRNGKQHAFVGKGFIEFILRHITFEKRGNPGRYIQRTIRN